jgi:transposase
MGCHQVVPFRTSRVADNNHQDMGRSRGGLTSKIHAVVDRNGLPVHLALTPGEAHDNRWCSVLLSALLPQTMLPADRGYDAHWIRVARLACRTPAKLSGKPDTGKVEAALLHLLRVERGLFGLQISYQFFCSIYRDLIVYREQYSSIPLDPLVDLNTFIAH